MVNDKYPDGMIELLRQVKRYPSYQIRFCTEHLKIQPSKLYLKSLIAKDRFTTYELWFGMRRQESVARAKRYADVDHDVVFDLNELFPGAYSRKIRARIQCKMPIVNLSTKETIKIITDYGVPMNPLYEEQSRVGCYPCFIASKEDITKCFNSEFGQIQLAKLNALDEEVGTDMRKWIKNMPEVGASGCMICAT